MIRHLQKIWCILGSSKNKLPLLLVIILFSSCLEALGIGLLGPFVSVISRPEKVSETSPLGVVSSMLRIESKQSLIIFLCLFIIFVFIVKGLAQFFSKYYILKFGYSHRGQMMESLNSSYLRSAYNHFSKKNSSSLIKNAAVETQVFCYKVLMQLLYGVSSLFIITFLFIVMVFTEPLLLIVALLALLPTFCLIYLMKRRMVVWGRKTSQSIESAIKTLNHGLGGFKETRILGCECYFEDQMKNYTKQYVCSASLASSLELLPKILIETTLVIFVLSFIALSQMLELQEFDNLVASLSVFLIASIRLLPASTQIVNTLGKLSETKHIVDILYADLKDANLAAKEFNKAEIQKNSESIKLLNEIQVLDIFYQYSSSSSPVIDGVEIKIKKGESIAFVGKSGAGKTTLVDIILGLLIPQSGDIKVDGVSIYQNLRSWQNLIGYIPQSIFLLDDSIAKNIAFGVSDELIDYNRLKRAIDAAQLTELVHQLPYGIETRVGERGVMLSGGQRQRVGIARALYHEREILVLDEATAALDNETEKLVSESIQNLAGKKTLITIAHRLSTVENCDRIYLLEKGRIVRSGKFSEVLAYL
jgi:ABC-type multidrug transport system fused ATPase/permease subunit